MTVRRCTFLTASGKPCAAYPMRGEPYCFLHHPDYSAEADEARRVGRARRRRELTIAGSLGIDGLRTVDDLQRVLEVALLETFALPNSVPRNRAIVGIVQVGLRAILEGELSDKVERLQKLVEADAVLDAPVLFDLDADEGDFRFVQNDTTEEPPTP